MVDRQLEVGKLPCLLIGLVSVAQRRSLGQSPRGGDVHHATQIVLGHEALQVDLRQGSHRQQSLEDLLGLQVHVLAAKDRLDVEDVPAAKKRRTDVERLFVQEPEYLAIRRYQVELERFVDGRSRQPVDQRLLEERPHLGTGELLDDLADIARAEELLEHLGFEEPRPHPTDTGVRVSVVVAARLFVGGCREDR